MSALHTTGLAGLDAQFGGGVPAGTVHLLLAEPMNAVELFTYHFAAGGLGKGPCTFASTDLTDQEVRDGIVKVGGKLGRLSVVTVPDEQGGWVPTIPDEGRFIVDNLSMVALNEGWDKTYAFLQEARAACRASGATLLVTATPGLQPVEQILLMKQWADGVMELGFDRQGFGLYPFLKVTKMRGIPDSARFLLFKETKKGLFMESTRRVF